MLLKPSEDMLGWQGTPGCGLTKRIQAALLLVLIAAFYVLTFSPYRLNLRLPSSTYTPASSLSSSQSPYAYVTLLAPNPKLDNEAFPDEEDEYFVATRVLAYQLLHAQDTATNSSIPFVVLVTPDVAESKVERLRKDGATVKVVEKIKQEWMKPGIPRWRDMLSKLRMFELTQYEKILFLDSDMFIVKRMDGIFTDETTEPLQSKPELIKADEAPLPSSYIFAAQTYIDQRTHAYPVTPEDYFSGGFFLAKPSIELFRHYISIAEIENRFDSNAMEQGLLNYAHRKDGPMPWAEVNYIYTTTWPSMQEYKAGAHSLHEKWWDQGIRLDPNLRKLWYIAKGEMLGFHEALESQEPRVGKDGSLA